MKLKELKHSHFLFLREEGVLQEKLQNKYLQRLTKGEKNGNVARDNVSCDK